MKQYELAYLENKIKAKAENHTKNNEGNKEESEEENKGESELELSPQYGNRSIGVCEDSENQKYRRRTTVHGKCEFCEQIYQDRSEI